MSAKKAPATGRYAAAGKTERAIAALVAAVVTAVGVQLSSASATALAPATSSSTTTAVTPASSHPDVQLVPLYEYAGSATLSSDWAAACAGNSVVVGTGASSGPPTSGDADWALEEEYLLPAMEACSSIGGGKSVAVGYVGTAYGSVPTSTVEEEMQQWVAFDPRISGFFLDEASDSSTASNEAYYAAVTLAARNMGRDEVVWNWGADSGTSSWPFPTGQSFATTWPSRVVVFEGSASSFSEWSPARWEPGSWTSSQGSGPYSQALAALVYSTPSSSLSGVCSEMDGLWHVRPNAFAYYVTNNGLPNPYSSLDSYNATEVSEC